MNTLDKPKRYLMLSAPFLLFVLPGAQVGVGILQFQISVVEKAHHDAWISVLVAGVAAHLVVWLMIHTLKQYESTDLYGMHYHVYGKWLGMACNIVYILFMLLVSLIILRSYIEVIQAWMFPELPTWLISSVILSLVIYGITGGIRTVIGFCVLSFFFTIWMFFMLMFDTPYGDAENFRPVAEAGIGTLLQGAQTMAFTLIGFEIIYFIYPFIKQKEQVQRYAHLGLLVTTLSYLVVIIVSIMYFSKGQILQTKWPTLSLFKIIQLPFLERLEYVIVSMWLIMILPNLLLYLWASSRGMKRMFQWKQKHALYLFSVILFICCINLETDFQLKKLGEKVNQLSFYTVFSYPFFLYGMVKIRKKYRKGKGIS